MLFANYCLYLRYKSLTQIKMDTLNNIQIFSTNGGINSGYYMSMCGNYMILHSKEVVGDTIVVAQKAFEMCNVEKVVGTYPLEQRTDIPKELLVETVKEENNG